MQNRSGNEAMRPSVITALVMIVLLATVGVTYAQPPVKPTPNFCPEPKQLTKKGLFWHVPEQGWVSYGESFDHQITQFVKVEWIGINVGKIICIYKGDKRFAFPIALEQKKNTIVPSPSGYRWSKDHGGFKECVSSDVKDCPFQFEQPKQDENPYEGLDFFKGKSDSDY